MPRLPDAERSRRQPDGRQPRLAPIGTAIAVLLVLATGLAVTLVWVALAWFHPRTVGDHLDVVKIALAIVGGIGGVVALVVAYRKQRLAEAGEERERSRLYAERFDTATDKLGSDSAAVRLAGVHALANLADDWEQGRQTCVDVLCAYLRMPAGPEPEDDGDPGDRTEWLALREVRATIVRLIAAHFKPEAAPSWNGCDLDFMRATFDVSVDFSEAVFGSGTVNFAAADFGNSLVTFRGADFRGANVYFLGVQFSGYTVDFRGAEVSGGVLAFSSAEFSGSAVAFDGVKITGGVFNFEDAEFSGGEVVFRGADFSGGWVDFGGAKFSGSEVDFAGAKFSGGFVLFDDLQDTEDDSFVGAGKSAEFFGGTVDFSEVLDWSSPPYFLPSPPNDVIIYPPESMTAPPDAYDDQPDGPSEPEADESP